MVTPVCRAHISSILSIAHRFHFRFSRTNTTNPAHTHTHTYTHTRTYTQHLRASLLPPYIPVVNGSRSFSPVSQSRPHPLFFSGATTDSSSTRLSILEIQRNESNNASTSLLPAPPSSLRVLHQTPNSLLSYLFATPACYAFTKRALP